MNQPEAIFPNETYLHGLREADAVVVEAVYNEFRQQVSRAVESAGGSYADGNAFFRAVVIQTGRVILDGDYPAEVPINQYLKALALAQYRAWLAEKGQEIPPTEETAAPEDAQEISLPSEEASRDFRKQIKAKRLFGKLEQQDQETMLGLAGMMASGVSGEEIPASAAHKASIEQFKKVMGMTGEDWGAALPQWVVLALTDEHFNKIWEACEAIERRMASSQIPQSGENKTIKYAFVGFVLLTLGYALFTWIFRDRTPAEVYENNFDPPKSIVEDMASRYANDSLAPIRPEMCTIAFSQADAHYKKRDWREAASELAVMMDDTLATCQSDALFYLAIIGLHLDKPELTLECIAKIEDLERYGEEIYWYMALAYVKIAAIDPSEKETARRAVQRALSNTEVPKRREQAEQMLEELSE